MGNRKWEIGDGRWEMGDSGVWRRWWGLEGMGVSKEKEHRTK